MINDNIKNKLIIYKWNIYIANIQYIDTDELKQRPVIILYIIGNSAIIIPLTTNNKKEHWSDIKFFLNKKENRAKLNKDGCQNYEIINYHISNLFPKMNYLKNNEN